MNPDQSLPMTPQTAEADDALSAIVTRLGRAASGIYGNRQEIKLVVAPAVAEALRSAVAAHLAVEQWVPGRRQTLIHSIYFDTADFELYRRSLQADAPATLKLRLRTYGDAATPDRADSVAFLEAKVGADGSDGRRRKRKARLDLSGDQVATLLGCLGADEPVTPATRKRFWRRVLAFMASDGVRPQLTVSYVREAFVAADGTLRVTIDSGYRASVVATGAVTPLPAPAADIGDSRIVEIKFLQALPDWLRTDLERLGLPPTGQSFSKFKTAVPLLFPIYGT